MRSVLALTIALTIACAPARRPSDLAPAPPDMDGVLRLVGRISFGHACPISQDLALTAAHVTDPRWFDRTVAPLPMVYSDGLGHEGVLTPVDVERARDLALMRSDRPFARWYPVASARPDPGERLLTLGYDFRRKREAFSPRIFELVVLRIVARNLVSATNVASGTSGSCVLNARGEAVAVIVWGLPTGDHDEATVAVGVWGERFSR